MDDDSLWEIEDEVEPVSTLEDLRTRQQIQSALADLPKPQAEMINQIYLQGKSHSEVAQETGLALGTVKSRVRLAMNKLKITFSETDLLDDHVDLTSKVEI